VFLLRACAVVAGGQAYRGVASRIILRPCDQRASRTVEPTEVTTHEGTPAEPIGVVGLGFLGMALVDRLTAAGYAVIGYDIDSRKIADLVQRGVWGSRCPSWKSIRHCSPPRSNPAARSATAHR
jgi:hypothetical protein